MSEVLRAMSGTLFLILSISLRASFAVRAPLHLADDPGIGVLKGDVEIRADLRLAKDLQEAVRDFLRIAVKKPDPFDSFEPDEPPDEPDQAVLQAPVPPIKGRILGYEVDLTKTPAGHRPGLFDDGCQAARTIGALDSRDGAE